MGNETLKSKPIKYFSDYTFQIKSGLFSNNIGEKIKITISLNLCIPGVYYQINTYSKVNENKTLLKQSEKLKSNNEQNIIFQTPILIDYFFEKEQYLIFEVIKYKNLIPEILSYETTIGKIVGSRKNTLNQQINLLNNENIILKAEKINESENFLDIHFIIESNKPIKYKKKKNKIFILIKNKIDLYLTEALKNNGNFSPIHIPLNLLKPNFTLIFYNNKKEIIKVDTTTLNDITNNYKTTINLSKKKFLYLESDSLIRKSYSFMDYLQLGIEIKLSIAIDFTQSNLNPKEKNSLHNISNNNLNDYENIIISIGNIMSYYNYEQFFPVFGFGAKLKKNNKINHCFPINFNEENPNIYTIDNVIKNYHNCLNEIELSEPTYFSPIINKINEMIKENNNNYQYNILLILTDGILNDVKNTINSIIESSFLPLSIIIIGIGNEDFNKMKKLNFEDEFLNNKKINFVERELIQFTEFNKYDNNCMKLIQDVLGKIPREVVKYYNYKRLFPENFKK